MLRVLSQELRLDPEDVAKAHLELALRFLDEAKMYLGKGDPVQASERLYKVAEECIKALAIKYNIPGAEEALKEGRWWTRLLSRAAKTLTTRLNEQIINTAWCVAYDLHVWGFHEAALTVDHVKVSLPHIEQLLRKTQQLLQT